MKFSQSAWMCALLLLWLLTGCAGMGDLPRTTFFSRPPSLMTPMTVERDKLSGHVSDRDAPSSVKNSGFLMPVSLDLFLPSSAPLLSQHGDGSVSIRSDGRRLPFSPGLDPADVNPAVLPFLSPSCDVPAFLVRDAR